MALAFADRVRETTTTTGTGTITLAGAITGYQSFSAIGDGNTTYYTINAGSQWEVGIGTYTASGTTLSRDTVLSSSNAGSLVDFSAGTKDVFAGYPAGKVVIQDASGNVGIGTSSPGQLLDVRGVVAAGAIGGGSYYLGNYNSEILAGVDSSGYYYGIGNGATSNIPITMGDRASYIAFRTSASTAAGSERMRIDASGNVGIGTTSPGARLGVSGEVSILPDAFGLLTVGRYDAGYPWSIVRPSATATGIEFRGHAGTTHMSIIQSTGNVNIGTNTSYGGKLTILPTANPTTASASTNQLAIGENSGNSAYKLNVGYIFSGGVYSGSLQAIAGGTGAALLLNADGGNVGIGTMSPSYRLHVNSGAATTVGFFQSTGTSSFIGLSNASYTTYLGSFNDGSFRIQTPGSGFSDKVTVDISGNVGIGTASPPTYAGYGNLAVEGTNGATFQLRNSAGTNISEMASAAGEIYLKAILASPLWFGTNNTERMRITSAGNVGIGTSSPISKFQVSGASAGLIVDYLGGNYYDANTHYFRNYGATALAYILPTTSYTLFSTNDANPLVFGTNNSERMRITSAGDVGIGTSSPGVKLDVNGVIRSNAWTFITPNTSTDNALYRASNTGGTIYMGLDNSAGGLSGAAYALSLYHSGAYPIVFSTNATERMRITSAGNVGIGTSSVTAGYKLDISGSANASGSFVSGGGTTNQTLVGNKTLLFYNTSVSEGVIQSADDTSTFTSVGISKDVVRFATQNSERMRITGGGDVGIGTSVPGTKLEVSNGASECTLRIRGGTSGSSSPQLQFYGNSSDHNWTIVGNHTAALTFNKGTFGAVGSELMRIDASGNLLVGTTSATAGYLMSVNGALTLANGYSLSWGAYNSGGPTIAGSTNFLAFYPNGASSGEKMRISSTGIVGIGVVPSANDFTGTVQTGWVGHGITPRTSTNLVFNMNANHSSGDWRYGNSGAAALYIQSDAGHAWYNAPSGTAGNVISFNEAMRITSAGNVGIGTTGPLGKFSVVGQGTTQVGFNAGTTGSPERGNIWYDTDNSGWKLNIGKLVGSTFTAQMTFQDNGNVGIGTTSPSVQLQINGSQPQIQWSNPTTGATSNDGTHLYLSSSDFWLVNKEAAAMVFATNNTEQVRITSAGNVGIGTSSPSTKLHVAGSADIRMTNTANTAGFDVGLLGGSADANAYVYQRASASLVFGTSNLERMRITSAGELLIGRSSASGLGKLNVEGGADFTGGNVLLCRDTGNVGVGTSSPGARLHVVATTTSGTYVIGPANVTSDLTDGTITLRQQIGAEAALGTTGAHSLVLRTNNTARLTINSSGGITSSDLADAVGYKGLPQNSQTTGYTLALSDMGKHISITTGNITIPANGSVAFPVGAAVTIFNNSGSTQTISITTDTLRQAGTTNTGTRTLAAYGVATVLKVASTTWVISGNVS